MSRIPVGIISDGGDTKKVASFFTKSHFDTYSVSGGDSKNFERGSFLTALEEAYKRSPSSYCVIIKDTTTSYYSSSDITTAIKSAESSDLVYLTRWKDRCDLSTLNKKVSLTNGEIDIMNVYAPMCYQAILISPELRDSFRNDNLPDKPIQKILYDLVHSGKVKSTSFHPNLFIYDNKYAKDMDAYYKSNLCAVFEPPIDNQKQITVETYIYLTVIVIFFLLIAYGLYLLGPVPKNYYETSSNLKQNRNVV